MQKNDLINAFHEDQKHNDQKFESLLLRSSDEKAHFLEKEKLLQRTIQDLQEQLIIAQKQIDELCSSRLKSQDRFVNFRCALLSASVNIVEAENVRLHAELKTQQEEHKAMKQEIEKLTGKIAVNGPPAGKIVGKHRVIAVQSHVMSRSKRGFDKTTPTVGTSEC
jgi:hypothetical protein